MESPQPPFSQISHDLEALKLALVGMTHEDIDPLDAEVVAREISAIRLQLKRLSAERVWAMERFDAARPSDPANLPRGREGGAGAGERVRSTQ